MLRYRVKPIDGLARALLLATGVVSAQTGEPMSTLAAHLELTKPRITALVVFTTAAGLWLAPALPPGSVVLLTIVGTAMAVAAANVLNMYLERDTDALMRTGSCAGWS